MRHADDPPPGRDEGRYSGPERRVDHVRNAEVEPVRLTRKYADAIDGVDLSARHVGDRLPLTVQEANLLLAEGWAEVVSSDERRRR